MMRVLALDIGGSSVKYGVVAKNDGGRARVLRENAPKRLPSRDFSDLKDIVVSVIRDAVDSADNALDAIAICTTGFVDDRQVVAKAGHFKDYVDVHWGSIISDCIRLSPPVVVVNDGRASAWAEYSARNNASSAAHYVVGTGIGGGIVMRGVLLTGDSGVAGYLGHVKVDPLGTVKCSCGSHGCVETVASGPAIVRSYVEGSPQSNLDLRDVEEAAAEGHPSAIAAYEAAGKWLGLAISHVLNILNPSVVTIGGGVAESSVKLGDATSRGPYVESAIEAALAAAHPRVARVTRIEPAQYGNEGGLIGAALFAADQTRQAS